MPRAGVHASRDLPILRAALAEAGLSVDGGARAVVRKRHRAIDDNQEDGDQPLHFMRGPDEEDASSAIGKALGHAAQRSRKAVDALEAWSRAPSAPRARREALLALADACHIVRDSYSKGHATRAPGPGGPRVVAMRAWEDERSPRRGFGLLHALLHDRRFERPFAWWAPEVPASDAAVGALAALIVRAARAEKGERERFFERAWRDFVRAHFLPDGAPAPDEEG